MIQVDTAARIVVDGNAVGTVAAQDVKQVPVSLGQHLVRATSEDESSASVQQVIEVKTAGQQVVFIALRDTTLGARFAGSDAFAVVVPSGTQLTKEALAALARNKGARLVIEHLESVLWVDFGSLEVTDVGSAAVPSTLVPALKRVAVIATNRPGVGIFVPNGPKRPLLQLVFQKDALLYSDSSLDITDEFQSEGRGGTVSLAWSVPPTSGVAVVDVVPLVNDSNAGKEFRNDVAGLNKRSLPADELKQLTNERASAFLEAARTAATPLAKSRNLSLIFLDGGDPSLVKWFDPSLDITKDLVAAMNRR